MTRARCGDAERDPPALGRWNGTGRTTANPGVWDVANSQNWTNLNSTASDAADRQFEQFDPVVLDDSIITSGGTNVLTITTNNAVVLPTSMTVNSTTNYVINGPGASAAR